MARYVVHVRTPRPPADAFAYMADLRNFAEWDPGVTAVDQTEGDGPGPGAVFAVTVKAFPKPLVLRYRTTSYEPPTSVVADAQSRSLRSLDTITVRADGAGSIVTYDASLTLSGILGLANPLLGLVFSRIGDRAAAGLLRVLDGERVDEPLA
ncbi:MAG TPA: SRPBCC family protein [Acidimicrobiia bacterium]|nr:SRPBCC family protein [Acidimicrobiia bacterium]